MGYWVPITNLGQYGLIKNASPYEMPLNAFHLIANARLDEKGIGILIGDRPLLFNGGGTFPTRMASYPQYLGTHFFGTTTNLYSQSIATGIWTNVTRSVGGNYNGPSWRFETIPSATGNQFIVIATNGVDVPQFFDVSVLRFENMTNWSPSTISPKFIKLFKNFLVAYNISDSGVPALRGRNHFKWSHSIPNAGGLPSSWDHTNASLDAGELMIANTDPAGIQDALRMGDAMMIYTLNGVFEQRYIGFPAVFSQHQTLIEGLDILGPRCVCAFGNGMHFVLGRENAYVHDGRQVDFILPEELRKYFYDELFSRVYSLAGSYVIPRSLSNEIWIHFITDQAFPSKILIWNWKKNIWTIREPHVATDTYADAWPYKPNDGVTKESLLHLIRDSSSSAASFSEVQASAYTGSDVRRHQVSFSRLALSPVVRNNQIVCDPSTVKMFTGIRVWTQGLNLDLTIKVGASMDNPSGLTWTTLGTFTPGGGFNDELNSSFHLEGRWFGYEIIISSSSATTINKGFIQKIELEFSDLGMR